MRLDISVNIGGNEDSGEYKDLIQAVGLGPFILLTVYEYVMLLLGEIFEIIHMTEPKRSQTIGTGQIKFDPS